MCLVPPNGIARLAYPLHIVGDRSSETMNSLIANFRRKRYGVAERWKKVWSQGGSLLFATSGSDGPVGAEAPNFSSRHWVGRAVSEAEVRSTELRDDGRGVVTTEGGAVLLSDLPRVGEKTPNPGVNTRCNMDEKASARHQHKRSWYKELLLNQWTLRWGFFCLKVVDSVRQWF